MLQFLLWFFFFFSSTICHAEFYTRYAEYHPYCSTPAEVAKRRIPPLSSSRGDSTKLVHVTAIFRHGARTPWGPNLNCWEHYFEQTSPWNCNLTAYSAPPPPDRAAQEGADVEEPTESSVWFEKRYDALLFPEYNLSNYLNGTCQLGQLIDQGYSQEIANGEMLREAYYENKGTVMPLLQLISPDEVYFRVDDEPRTLMSGQLVLRGLLGSATTTIPLHTADFTRDIVDPNENICPRLVEIREANEQSPGYRKFLADHQILRDFQRDVLKPPQSDIDMHAIDCLMTTMCTDRPLPDSINDYGGKSQDDWDATYGPNRFQRLYEYDVQKYTYNLKANNAEYAKVSMGPLWYEILQQIQPHLLKPSYNVPKIHIVSGHDTTVMPLLVALDSNLWPDTEWPAYASMIVLELYQNEDAFFFRLVYNGKVLILDACEGQELCDIQILLDRLEPFAIPNPECQAERQATLTNQQSAPTSLAVAIGAILGAAVMYLIQHVSIRRTTATPLPQNDDHDGIMRNGRGVVDDDDNNSLI